MSLILDALKKAQTEQQQSGPKILPSANPIISDKSAKPKTLPLLIILSVLSLIVMVYLRYFSKSSPTVQPIAAIPGVQNNREVGKLKEQALRAFGENRLPESVEIWRKVALLAPVDAEIYNNLGLALKKSGQKEEAYQAYAQALALKKEYPEALNNLGVLLLEDGAKDKAKASFLKALSLNKMYADPYFNLSLILEQEGNTRSAAEQYRQFLILATDLDPELRKKIEIKVKDLQTP